ncbi:MAG: hypothetical protein ABIV63_02955 [Caldimonas sp.]
MIGISLKVARLTLVNVRSRAVLFGLLFGWVASELSKVPERGTYNLAMAVVMIVAGSASFVLHALHLQREAAPRGWTVDRADVRHWICLIGSGVAVSLGAVQQISG